MITHVQKWGNSLAIRIPSLAAREMMLMPGHSVDLEVDESHLVITPIRPKKFTLATLLKQITPKNLHAEIHTGDAAGLETF